MNIQIFGVSKSADTRKAERYFKERRIKFQSVDMKKYGMSGGEFDSVLRAVGGVENLIDWDSKSPDLDLIRYMADPLDKEDKLFENQMLIRMPVVRNGKQATVGYCPEIWKTWEEGDYNNVRIYSGGTKGPCGRIIPESSGNAELLSQ